MLKTLLQSMRLPFLLLTPACVLLGWALTVYQGLNTHIMNLVLCIAGGLFAHISVNLLNEFADFQSGLDLTTQKTPFSGGSGALPANPDGAKLVLSAGLLSLAATTLIGVYFLTQNGWLIAPLGLLGLVIIVAYTPWLNRSPLLCLIAPGTAFGPLMVVGSYVCLAGSYSVEAWLLSLIPFFLVNNLLLLNQFPDVEADRNAGRRHIAIAYGLNRAAFIYSVFAAAAAISLTLLAFMDLVPSSTLWLLPLFGLSIFSAWGGFQYQQRLGHHPQFMAANVLLSLAMPFFIAGILLVGN